VAEPSVASVAEQCFQRPVSLQPSAQRSLGAAQTDWNLAQFDLTNTGSTRTLKRLNAVWQTFMHAPQWRPARWCSVLLLAIHLIGLNTWAWQERSALDSQRAAIRSTLSDTFPEVKVIVDAPLQMARALTQLQQATGTASGQDLEAMLGQLSALLPADQSLSAIEFTAGQARVKGLSLSPEAATTLSAQMKTKGYAVRTEADSLLIQQAEQVGQP
jgi:general secretion pathway protein L